MTAMNAWLDWGDVPLDECEPDGWLICQYPERPPTRLIHIHMVKCRACRIGLEAFYRQNPERWALLWDLQSRYWAENVESPPLSPSSGL